MHLCFHLAMQAIVPKPSSGITATHLVTPQRSVSRTEGQLSWTVVRRHNQEHTVMADMNFQLFTPTRPTWSSLLERERENDGAMLRNTLCLMNTKEDEKSRNLTRYLLRITWAHLEWASRFSSKHNSRGALHRALTLYARQTECTILTPMCLKVWWIINAFCHKARRTTLTNREACSLIRLQCKVLPVQ